MSPQRSTLRLFLSSNTQDFIEVRPACCVLSPHSRFLSSNTQDFIEVGRVNSAWRDPKNIPEL